jgi:hypothetical protein
MAPGTQLEIGPLRVSVPASSGQSISRSDGRPLLHSQFNCRFSRGALDPARIFPNREVQRLAHGWPSVRDQVVDFVGRWSEATGIGAARFIEWLAIGAGKFYDWRDRYGQVKEHNGWVPRDFWLKQWEKKAIIDFHLNNPLEGYRRLTFMMLDQDIVAVSPSSVWRVLGQAGLLSN